MNWKQWLVGLANGVISGVASGVPASLIGANWKQVGAIAGTSAIVSVLKWVVQHPLPGAIYPYMEDYEARRDSQSRYQSGPVAGELILRQ